MHIIHCLSGRRECGILDTIAPDGARIGRVARLKPLPSRKPQFGQGLVRNEIQRHLRHRGWDWTDLRLAVEKLHGEPAGRTLYWIRRGERATTPLMVRRIVSGFGSLTAEQERRLHVAAALDMGYRLGG